jgi:benzil reductase ((S)-benzoin forming)
MKHLTLLTGASRGMGLSMARQLLTAGHTVLCISRTSVPELDAHARHVGATVLQWEHDLADSGSLNGKLESWLKDSQAARPLGQRHADQQRRRDPADRPAERDRRRRPGAGAARRAGGAHANHRRLPARHRGWKAPRKVLNISSGLGRKAMASQAAYCAAKAGMDHFTRCLALEEALKPQGAKVCSLAPGVIDTGMQEQLRAAPAEAFPDKASFVGLKTGGSLTSPDDAAARIIAFLARPDFARRCRPAADVRD